MGNGGFMRSCHERNDNGMTSFILIRAMNSAAVLFNLFEVVRIVYALVLTYLADIYSLRVL